MHTLEIPSGKICLKYASCIEELSPREFPFMMKLLLMQQAGEISIHDFRVRLVVFLLKIRKTYKFYLMSDVQREGLYENISRLADSLNSFYDNVEENGSLVKRLNLNFIKQMLPAIKGLHGPDDALTNLTFFEYKEAYRAYTMYVNSKDEEDLNELIAILYQPRPFLYRIRKRFALSNVPSRTPFTPKSSALLETRKRVVKGFPDHIKVAIFLWFGNCVEYVCTGKPRIDGNEIDFALLFNSKNQPATPGIGLTGVLFSLAESGVFGNVLETGNTNLYDVLVRLYQLKTDFDSMITKSKSKNDTN